MEHDPAEPRGENPHEEDDPPDSTAGAVSGRVGEIVEAAEHAAENLRVLAEARVRERIAEAQRAADMRVAAAEQEAAEVLAEAEARSSELAESAAAESEAVRAEARREVAALRVEAERRAVELTHGAREQVERERGEADAYGQQVREEADARAEALVSDARRAGGDVLAQASELSENLRALGDSLYANADRLLRDVRLAHQALMERVQLSGRGREPRRAPGDGVMLGEREPVIRGRTRPVAPPRRTRSERGPEQFEVPEFVPARPSRAR